MNVLREPRKLRVVRNVNVDCFAFWCCHLRLLPGSKPLILILRQW